MRKQKGFGLLEILITLVLLGVGVAGLVALARSMLGSAQEGRRYEVAMRLAESKLDEFRNFNGVASKPSGATGTLYKDIMSSATPQTALNDYSVSWTVDNQYLTSGVWSTANLSSVPYPDRKLVTVTVGWKDNANTPRTLELAGAIAPTGSLTQSGVGSLLTPRQNPKVNYTKGSVPDVVAIELGNGSNKETSKPLPSISKGSGSSRTIQFETTTYQTTGQVSTNQAQQDTATVYCSCKYEGLSSATLTPPEAYLPAVPHYMQSDKVQYWNAGQHVNVIKPIGTLDGNANQQEGLCSSCCQDHYDLPSSANFSDYYDPLDKGRSSSRSNGVYLDACRFIRIDGFYRPAPDWHLVSLTTFSANFLNDATNLANYRSYMAEMVKRYTLQQKRGSNWSTLSTDTTIAIQDFNTWWLSNNLPGSSTALLTTVGTVQLISRGIYVDIMSPDYLANVVYAGKANPDLNDADLAKIPFQDVNMTLLSHWSSNNSNGTVTSQPIANMDSTSTNNAYDNNYYGTYSRGRLAAKNTTYTGSGTPATDQPITITAKSYKNNLGVVGADIPPTDNTSMVSTMQVSIQAPAQLPTTNVHGVIKCLDLKATVTGTGNNKVTVNSAVPCTEASKNLNKTVSNGNVTCQIQDIGSPAETSYSCSGPATSFFTLALDKHKYQFSSASQSFTPSIQLQFTLPSSGTLASGCVLMVSDDLKNANPAPSPAIPTSCDIQP